MNLVEDEARKNYFSLFPEELIASVMDAFVINKPMNGKVGGDGFWVHQTLQHLYIVVFDCMGHGHFASMMTRVYIQSLEEVIVTRKEEDPGQILLELHETIKAKFQNKKNLKIGSGADVGVLKIDTLVRKIDYAGARMDLFHVRNGRFETVKAGRLQVGDLFDYDHEYETANIDLIEGIKSNFYLATDGLKDLVGGEGGKKLGKHHVVEILASQYEAPMTVQKEEIHKDLKQWKGDYESLDDMLIVGLSL